MFPTQGVGSQTSASIPCQQLTPEAITKEESAVWNRTIDGNTNPCFKARENHIVKLSLCSDCG